MVLFLAWTPVARAWSWPLAGPVLQPFTYDEAHPYASGQHRGIDIGAQGTGEAVVAPASGTVAFAGTVPTSGVSLTIATGDGYSVTLTHLGTILVARGGTIVEGDEVATVGPSGTAEVDGPYVHLGVRMTDDPDGYVDPLSLLPAPADESPPAESEPPAVQPSASAGAATTTPAAAQPAPVTATPVGTETSSARPGTSHRARGRIHAARPDAQQPRSAQRPVEETQVRTAVASGARHSKQPTPRVSEPIVFARRPVVEPARSAGLDTGLETKPTTELLRPRHGSSGALLGLLCNGLAALVAVTAALAVARSRRRRPASAIADVLELPRAVFDRRNDRRAA
jgi:hypothetical protein